MSIGTTSEITDPHARQAMEVIEGSKGAIMSAWEKIRNLGGKTDLLAIVDPGEEKTAVLVIGRESGLQFLTDNGCDLTHPSLEKLQHPARGTTPESSAIWVVVRLNDKITVGMMINQPMSQGGIA